MIFVLQACDRIEIYNISTTILLWNKKEHLLISVELVTHAGGGRLEGGWSMVSVMFCVSLCLSDL